jgi:HEAT repeat protein
MAETLEFRLAEIERLAAGGGEAEVRALTALLGNEEWQTRRAAAAALSTVIPALENIESRDRSIVDLLAFLGSPIDPPKRAAAIVALEAIGRMALPHLAVALTAASAPTRTALAGVIGGAGGAGAVALLEPLSKENDPNVVAASILALGRTRSSDALPLLLAQLDGDDEWVKFAAVGALGELGDGRAVDRLAGLIDAPLLRETAIAALVEIGTLDAARAVGGRIMAEDRTEINTDALTALLSIVAGSRNQPAVVAEAIHEAAREAVTESCRQPLLDALTNLLPDGETAKINACLTALGWLGERNLLPVIGPLLRDSAFAQSAREMLISLAATEQGVSDVVNLTPDLLPIAEASSVLSEARSVAALVAALQLLNQANDEETSVELLVAVAANSQYLRAGADQLTPAAREHLVELLTERLAFEGAAPSVEVARALGMLAANWERERILRVQQRLRAGGTAKAALASLAFLTECEPLLALASGTLLVKHPSALVRVAAIDTIARVAPRVENISLATLLTDESSAVRRAAARSLRWLGSSSDGLRALVASLSDDDVWVRVETIGTLSKLAGHESMYAERLTRELRAAHPLCRVAAIEAQLSMSVPDREKLSELAENDPHPEVRTAAWRVLASHPRQVAPLAPLERALSDPDWAVRLTAIDLALVFGYREPVERIAVIAEDVQEVPAVRAHAVRALARWSHGSAVRVAVAAVDDPAPIVTEAGFDALAQLGGTRAAELEAHYLHCPPRAANLLNFILRSNGSSQPTPNHPPMPAPSLAIGEQV